MLLPRIGGLGMRVWAGECFFLSDFPRCQTECLRDGGFREGAKMESGAVSLHFGGGVEAYAPEESGGPEGGVQDESFRCQGAAQDEEEAGYHFFQQGVIVVVHCFPRGG